ncbi:MAG: S1C family serine protease [Oscillospiraceae bacterium]|jgi:serine protease Do
MNYNNNSHSSWYRGSDRQNGGHARPDYGRWDKKDYSSSLPADADSAYADPIHSAGPSSPYRDTYWTPVSQHKDTRRTTKILTLSISALIIAIAASMIFMGSDKIQPGSQEGLPDPGYEDYQDYIEDFYKEVPRSKTSIPAAEVGTGVTMELAEVPREAPLSLQQIYKKCSPAVVAITANVSGRGFYWGTGIILDENGYIVTNAHIIEGTESVTVTLHDDREFKAKLVGYDSRSDIAVLKIDAEGLPCAEFGDSSSLEVGDEVLAIGNPLGEELRGTMTDGIISAINRGITYNGHSMTLLQTNAAINEGNSGGPLINMHGQVIGITNMKMMSKYTNIEGIGFAIPTAVIKPIVDELIRQGFVAGRPAIGITVGNIPPMAEQYYTLPEGLYVTNVEKNSDAYKKGIREGDIITEANGTPVSSTEELNAIKDTMAVGDTLLLTVYRNGETFVVDVVLMDMSELYG